MDELNIQNAKSAYAKICESLDALGWKYSKTEEDLVVECGVIGENLPIALVIRCDVDMQLFQLFSHLPITVSGDKLLDVAVAVSVINNKLVDGCFDFSFADGSIFFRMTNSFMQGTLSFETVKYLVFCACSTVDSYNDKLLMVAKGNLSIEDFLQKEI